jgi:hypothetical protein
MRRQCRGHAALPEGSDPVRPNDAHGRMTGYISDHPTFERRTARSTGFLAVSSVPRVQVTRLAPAVTAPTTLTTTRSFLAGRVTHVPITICHPGPETRH